MSSSDSDSDNRVIVISDEEDDIGRVLERSQENEGLIVIEDSDEGDGAAVLAADGDSAASSDADSEAPASPRANRSLPLDIEGNLANCKINLAPKSAENQCKVPNCTVAPDAHKRHPMVLQQQIQTFERKIIIEFLVQNNIIQYGKGIKIWSIMNELGYLTHRSPQTLNNHFKKYLLRDIKSFHLSKDIEDQFLELQKNQVKKY